MPRFNARARLSTYVYRVALSCALNWKRSQRPSHGCRVDPAELTRHLSREMRRRSRFFAYELFCLSLGLVLVPLLAVVNYIYQQPESPILYWFRACLTVALAMVFFIGVLRRLRRHRELTQTRTDTVAAFAAKALANIEAEARDYHAGLGVFGVWFGLAVLAIYVNHPILTHGWMPFGIRLAMVMVFMTIVGAVYVRHYYRNLMPELARRKQLFKQLS